MGNCRKVGYGAELVRWETGPSPADDARGKEEASGMRARGVTGGRGEHARLERGLLFPYTSIQWRRQELSISVCAMEATKDRPRVDRMMDAIGVSLALKSAALLN
jgi:hypothetical protein